MDVAEHRKWLVKLRDDAKAQLDEAQSDYDAITRAIAYFDEMSPSEPATVEGVRVAGGP